MASESARLTNYSRTQSLNIEIGDELYVVYEMLGDGRSGYGNSNIHGFSKTSKLDALKSAGEKADGNNVVKVRFVRCVTDYDFDDIIHCAPESPAPGLVLADAEYKGGYSGFDKDGRPRG